MKRMALLATLVAMTGCGGGDSDAIPELRIVAGPDGTKVAQIDQAAYEAFCREHALPAPPAPPALDHLAFGFIHEANAAAARDRSPETIGALAMFYDGNGARESAIQCYEMLVVMEPDEARWWHLLGRAHVGVDARAAVEALRRAVDVATENAAGYARLGDQLLEIDDVAGAAEAFDRAAQTLGDDPFVRFGLARVAIAQENWDEARRRLQAVLALDPSFKPAVNQMAAVHRARGELDDARQWLERARQLEESLIPSPRDPIVQAMMEQSKSADYYKALMEALFNARRYRGAYDAILQILERQPNLAVYQRNAAALAKLNGNLDAALAHAKRAVELNSKYATGYTVLGELLRDLGRMDEAIDSARSAIDLDPVDPMNYLSLGAILVSARRFEAALVELETGLADAPDHITGLRLKAQCLAELQRRDEARAVLGRILQLDPANAWALRARERLDS